MKSTVLVLWLSWLLLVYSNLSTKIRKNIKTCKLFWPASEDFVNSATVFVNSATAFVNSATAFVNSATRRGEGPPGPPNLHFLSVPPERCSFVKRAKISVLFSGAEKRTKRDIPPTKAFPRGKDATAPPRRSLHQGTPGHHSPGVDYLNGALPHKKSLRMECAEGVLYGV